MDKIELTDKQLKDIVSSFDFRKEVNINLDGDLYQRGIIEEALIIVGEGVIDLSWSVCFGVGKDESQDRARFVKFELNAWDTDAIITEPVYNEDFLTSLEDYVLKDINGDH